MASLQECPGWPSYTLGRTLEFWFLYQVNPYILWHCYMSFRSHFFLVFFMCTCALSSAENRIHWYRKFKIEFPLRSRLKFPKLENHSWWCLPVIKKVFESRSTVRHLMGAVLCCIFRHRRTWMASPITWDKTWISVFSSVNAVSKSVPSKVSGWWYPRHTCGRKSAWVYQTKWWKVTH